jgi:CubicO group peptidase (beta-lactamase class C family)
MQMGIGALFDPAAPINAALGEAGLAPGPRLPDYPTGDAYAAALSALPLMRQPREHWLDETPMQLLGVVLERAADKSLADVMAETIFDPLGMEDTGFFVPEAKRGRLATAWWRNYGTGVFEVFDGARAGQPLRDAAGLPDRLGRVGLDRRRLAELRPHDARRRRARRGAGAVAGVRGRADPRPGAGGGEGALAVRGGVLGGGRLGPRVQVVTNGGPGDPLGYGWVGGTGTSGYFDPATGVVGVHLTQRVMESPEPTAVFTEFWTGVRAAAGV